MVTDATVPSLVLLTVLVTAVVVARLVDTHLHHHRRRGVETAGGTRGTRGTRGGLRLPRVVLVDDDTCTDSWTDAWRDPRTSVAA